MTEPSHSGQQAQATPPQMLQIFGAQVPRVYFNGFGLLGGATDATIVLQNGQQTVAMVQAGYSVLKELAIAIDQMVKQNESQLGIEHIRLSETLQKLQGGGVKTP